MKRKFTSILVWLVCLVALPSGAGLFGQLSLSKTDASGCTKQDGSISASCSIANRASAFPAGFLAGGE